MIRSINKFSLSRGTLEPQASGFPGRDIITTLFNDAELRLGYALDQVWRRETVQNKAKKTTAREVIKSLIATDNEPFIRFLVLREGTTVGAKNELTSDIETITSNLQPNDMLIVRCGPLTHITKISKIDREEGKILFSDPLWEFWQPTHNSCVNMFSVVKDSYNRFFPSIPLQDVSSMIEAVVTLRNLSDDDIISGISLDRAGGLR